MSHLKYHHLFIAFLASSLVLADAPGQAPTGDIELGFAHYETVAVDSTGGHMRPWIVVRTTNRNGDVRSFGMSNEAGVLFQPLPPGEYCFDAFSDSGRQLRMNRPANERCFEVTAGKDVIVGVGFRE